MALTDKRREYKHAYYKRNLEAYMLQRARRRAKQKGLMLDIVVEDIIIPEVCPILGLKLVASDYKASPHLDRINPRKGYIKGNVRVISGLANRIKTDATPEEILKVALFLKENSL